MREEQNCISVCTKEECNNLSGVGVKDSRDQSDVWFDNELMENLLCLLFSLFLIFVDPLNWDVM